jgi:hypothetical protein
MSYAICRVQKIGSGSDVTGIQIHNRRERDHSNSNPDIDPSLKHCNITLYAPCTGTFNDIAEDIIKTSYKGSKAIRKDAVRVCELLFTSDNDFFVTEPDYLSYSVDMCGYQTPDWYEKKTKKTHNYFQKCFDWACERYGKQNIISAIIHFDEKTPHLHIDFVPMTADGRLSAKAVLGGRKDLQAMQDDFYTKVGKSFGLERGKRCELDNPNDIPRKHKTTEEYKRAAELQQIENTRKELETLKKLRVGFTERTAQLEKKHLEMNVKISDLSKKISQYEAQKTSIEQELKNKKAALSPYNEYYVGKKSAFGGSYSLTAKEYEEVINAARSYYSTQMELRETKAKLQSTQEVAGNQGDWIKKTIQEVSKIKQENELLLKAVNNLIPNNEERDEFLRKMRSKGTGQGMGFGR